MDFQKLTPIEYMAIADRERVHTALLAWVLGQHSPLTLEKRALIVARLAGLEPMLGLQATYAETEVAGLDLLVTVKCLTDTRYLAVEAKLKSNEHSAQLKRYTEELLKRGIKANKVFLTLDGTLPESDETWIPVSYGDLYSVLSVVIGEEGNSNQYLHDYILLVKRLAHLVELAENPEASLIFFNQSVIDPEGITGLSSFLELTGLSKTLQEIWMRRLGRSVFQGVGAPEGWQIEVGETNKNALLNIMSTSLISGFSVGLQVQYQSIKMFCAPYPYIDAEAATITRVAEIITQMMGYAGVSGRPTTPRTKGFSSIKIGNAPEGRNPAAWKEAVETAFNTVLVATRGLKNFK